MMNPVTLERITRALESIAASLERTADSQELVKDTLIYWEQELFPENSDDGILREIRNNLKGGE